MEAQPARIWFLGHATVVIDLDGTRIVTDPLLRGRVSALIRRHPAPDPVLCQAVDGVLISHMHYDHLDVPSLRQIGTDVPHVVPRRAGQFLQRRGFKTAIELRPGESATVGRVRVRATRAKHVGFRPPFGPLGDCIGFVVEGSLRVYFAGDTDLFPEMGALGPIDVALLPVAGWGPSLGPGHMDARRAAQALALIRPKVAIPIHWGTFAPVGMHLRTWRYLHEPPVRFRHEARRFAPEVDVQVLEPGEMLALTETPRDIDGDGVPDVEDLEHAEPLPALPHLHGGPNG